MSHKLIVRDLFVRNAAVTCFDTPDSPTLWQVQADQVRELKCLKINNFQTQALLPASSIPSSRLPTTAMQWRICNAYKTALANWLLLGRAQPAHAFEHSHAGGDQRDSQHVSSVPFLQVAFHFESRRRNRRWRNAWYARTTPQIR